MRMPDDFRIEAKRGRVDQRKAGAKQIVEYVGVLQGKAGYYLVLDSSDNATRSVYPRRLFVALDEEAPEPD